MFSIRSKRKRRAAPAGGNEHRRNGRGRPMKPVDELSIPKTVLNAQLRKLQREAQSDIHAPGSAPSPLEELPNELLQQVFFHCFEINLPRASPRLARALSTESTWNALILFAYFDDDEQHPVEAKHFLPAVYRPLWLEQRVRLQGEILSCRWCTLERITACLPTLSRLVMAQAWHRERAEQETLIGQFDGSSEPEVNFVTPSHVPADLARLPRLEDDDDLSRHFFAQAEARDRQFSMPESPRGSKSSESYLPRIITWSSVTGHFESEETTSISKTPHQKVSVLAAHVLPDQLVRGSPWTQRKLELLQLLRQGFRFLQRNQVLEISAPAVFEGMASAIREKNVAALLTLLELHSGVFESPAPSDEPSLSPPTNHALPAQLFRLATEAGNLSATFMWLLIRGGGDSIPRDDEILTGWALRVQDQNNEAALWLLNHMSCTADYQLGRRGYLFVRGARSWRASGRLDLPAERTFAEELGYLKGGTTSVPTNLYGEACG